MESWWECGRDQQVGRGKWVVEVCNQVGCLQGDGWEGRMGGNGVGMPSYP